MNYILIGPPGSGKGTASSLFANYGYIHISTGDLLREQIKEKTRLGLLVSSVISSGRLVDDRLIIDVVDTYITNSNKYIFDGFPRSIAQAEYLSAKLLNSGMPYKILNFQIDKDLLKQRIVNRRTSPDGKHIYNLITSPPKVENICDVTGEKLVHRADDHEDAFLKRYTDYLEYSKEILIYFSKLTDVITIDASKSIDYINANLRKLLEDN